MTAFFAGSKAQAGTVMAWDPENGGTLIGADIVGQMPWTMPSEDGG